MFSEILSVDYTESWQRVEMVKGLSSMVCHYPGLNLEPMIEYYRNHHSQRNRLKIQIKFSWLLTAGADIWDINIGYPLGTFVTPAIKYFDFILNEIRSLAWNERFCGSEVDTSLDKWFSNNGTWLGGCIKISLDK